MNIESDRIRNLAVHTGAWTALYALFRLGPFKARSAVFSNRLVSFVHAFVAISLTSAALDPAHPFRDFGKLSKPLEVRALSVSLGYFIYDTVCCLFIEHDIANTAHHVCTIIAVAIGVLQGTDGAELTECLILMEVSNPFLHARYFLKELGHSKTTAATWNDVLFAMTFFVCRLILGPFITFYTLVSPTASYIVKAGGSGIQIVSCVWAYKIVRMALRKLGSSNHHQERGIKDRVPSRDRTVST